MTRHWTPLAFVYLGLSVVVVTHDPDIAARVDRVIAIRDGRTSTEVFRRVRHDGNTPEFFHEEYVLVDAAGRLQIPPDLRAEVGIGSRVTLERSSGGILIRPVDGPQPAGNAAARAGDGGDDGPLPAPRPGLRGRLKWPRRVK